MARPTNKVVGKALDSVWDSSWNASKDRMLMAQVLPLAALFHHAIPIVWIIGLVLIVGGVISMIRGGVIVGIILVIIGIVLGGLMVL
jgi:hypothetical protein